MLVQFPGRAPCAEGKERMVSSSIGPASLRAHWICMLDPVRLATQYYLVPLLQTHVVVAQITESLVMDSLDLV